MLPLDELRWTTRGEVCAPLLEHLIATGPATGSGFVPWNGEEPYSRRRVGELFCLLADETFVPALRQILMEREEAWSVRWAAREALERLEAVLPPEELAALLEDRSLWEDPSHTGLVSGLFRLFRSAEGLQLARAFLRTWTPEERARLLAAASIVSDGIPRELADWLCWCWLDRDRHLLEHLTRYDEPLNVSIASRTCDRDQSLLVLLDYWRGAEGEWRAELRERLWDCDNPGGIPAQWVEGDPRALQELAEGHKLVDADLINYFGEEALLARIEKHLRRISRERRKDPSDYSAVVNNMKSLRIVA
jgi:hypothetical protein